MDSLTSSKFWLRVAERATKTFAQVALVAIGQDTTNVDLFQANLGNVAALAVSAAALSVLTSIAAAPFGPVDDPSLIS